MNTPKPLFSRMLDSMAVAKGSTLLVSVRLGDEALVEDKYCLCYRVNPIAVYLLQTKPSSL